MMFSTVGDIMINLGDILSTVGDIMSTTAIVRYRGVYHLMLFEYFHCTEHPHGPFDIPTIITISPMVLNIPNGTQQIPHGTEHKLYRVMIHQHSQQVVVYMSQNPCKLDPI